MEGEMEYPVNKYITAGSIISSLGFDTKENLSCIREYRSGITRLEDTMLFDEPFMAARIDDSRLNSAVSANSLEGYSRMEQLFILCLSDVISQSGVDPADPDCALVISTTKGNIDSLRQPQETFSDAMLFKMAERIAGYFLFAHEPIVISNACISGVSALIVASRLIEAGTCKKILVAGGDILTRFVVTGFHSFKSISPQICKPYDETRDGLSLGEACGAVLVTSDLSLVKENQPVMIRGGAITNDANHISGPSRSGDGLYYAISQAMDEAALRLEDISFVNTHGTATLYNDEMESKAVHLAGLDHLPLNSMKSYWGHTLGASGIIEVIACMEELRSGEVFATLGFQACGLPFPLSVSGEHRRIDTKHCVKTASGFGGCNAAIVLSLAEGDTKIPTNHLCEEIKYSQRSVLIEQGRIVLDKQLFLETDPEEGFDIFIRTAYKSLGLDNRKFYKMDDLCKLGYIAAATLFLKNGGKTGYASGEVGMVFANASSSLDTDLKHQHIIDSMGDKEASPAVFVYTLPNVVMGELCICYKIQGENTFFINNHYPEFFIRKYAMQVIQKQKLRACLIGWCELLGNKYEARFDWLEQITD